MKPVSMDYVGQRISGKAATAGNPLYTCQSCGQEVDKRDLAAVFHHEQPGHAPMPADDAERLRRIDQALHDAVAEQTPHDRVDSAAEESRHG